MNNFDKLFLKYLINAGSLRILYPLFVLYRELIVNYLEIVTWPNILTLFRILIAPYIAYLMMGERFKEAVIWSFLAGMSDLFDGLLSRCLGQESSFGAAFDPLADKIFSVTLLMTCVCLGLVPGWFFALVVLREILILGGVTFLSYYLGGVEFSPIWSSKINTLFLFLFIGSSILKNLFPLVYLTQILLVATTLTTLYSGTEYIYLGWTIFKNGSK